jgi:hypothetical protein
MPLDGSPSPLRERIEQIVMRAAEAFNVPPGQITGRARARYISRARWAVWITMRDRMNMTMPQIGRAMGVDHTSVLHGLRSASKLMVGDPEYAARVTQTGGDLVSVPHIADTTPGPPAQHEPIAAFAADLDYIALDWLTRRARNKLQADMRKDLPAFRLRYAKTYKRVREAAQ